MVLVTIHNIAIIDLWNSPIVDGKRFKLRDNIKFSYEGRSFNILAGFVWDGASIPWIATGSTGAGSSPAHLRASLIHDYLYTHGSTLGWSQKTADIIYKKTLSACGKGGYTVWKEYRALRMFGKRKYKK